MPSPLVDGLSRTALQVTAYFGTVELSRATGFAVLNGDQVFLVTNWHVVAGRNCDTDACLSDTLAVPDRLHVRFHKHGEFARWVEHEIALLDDEGSPLWLEHPAGHHIDVVAIPMPRIAGIAIYPLDLSLADAEMAVQPATPISIIGYPLGLSAAGWPIWKTGHVASEPDLDYAAGHPAFLVDSTTKRGMSGSPVIYRASTYQLPSGAVTMGLPRTKLLGIYSGRLTPDSDVGRVWRAAVLRELLPRRGVISENHSVVPLGRNDPCHCGSGRRFKECHGSLSSGPK